MIGLVPMVTDKRDDEICRNGIDDNGNGRVNEGYSIKVIGFSAYMIE